MGVDLHIHTIFSDGTLSPYETVKMGKLNGLMGLSITDHDEVGGIEEAFKAGKKLGIKVIPGVEFSAKYNERSLHILGYFIDYKNPKVTEFVVQMREARYQRAIKIIEKLEEQGFHITLDEVKSQAGIGNIGRPHIASVLINKGLIKNTQEAFNLYLGDGKPCYISKSSITPDAIISLILETGGIPVLAHPGLNKMDENIPELIEKGIKGIEVWTPGQRAKETKKYLDIAEKYNLVTTGGSDSHGTRAGYPQVGEFCVPNEVLEKLEKSWLSKLSS